MATRRVAVELIALRVEACGIAVRKSEREKDVKSRDM